MASVRQAAEAILADEGVTGIDAIINNAGAIFNDFERTVDGFERHLAINHLSHFLLTNLLMPLLLRTPFPRVINHSSLGHKYSYPNFDDPNFQIPGSFTPQKGYGQSKAFQILFSVSLNDKLGSKGLKSYAIHPGNIATTLYSHLLPEILTDMATVLVGTDPKQIAAAISKTPQQGCAPGLVAALGEPDGVYLGEDCRATTNEKVVAPWALEKNEAETCWRLSEDMLGQKSNYEEE
jgi:NAD(P)-dependent dehydrogenase (short-subunit alcohol dehydrogenase family)